MTVKEAIEMLSKLPPNAPVFYADNEDGFVTVTDHDLMTMVEHELKHPNGQAYSYYNVYNPGRFDHVDKTPFTGVVLK